MPTALRPTPDLDQIDPFERPLSSAECRRMVEIGILGVEGRAVDVGREPEGRAYRDLVCLAEGAEVGIAALPDLAPLPVADLFPATS